jgi:hypothetical protein
MDSIFITVWLLVIPLAGLILIWGPKYRKLAVLLILIGLSPYAATGYSVYQIYDNCEFKDGRCFYDVLWDTP